MPNYKLVGTNKGNKENIATFTRREDAESEMAKLRRSGKYGSMTIIEDGADAPRSKPGAGRPAQRQAPRHYEVENPLRFGKAGSKSSAYTGIIWALVGILVLGIAMIIGFNYLLTYV